LSRWCLLGAYKKIIQELELSTYEERFCIEDECIEVYKVGTIDECENFIKNISDVKLQREFEITKINEK